MRSYKSGRPAFQTYNPLQVPSPPETKSLPDRNTRDTALALMAQYGDDAEVIAMMRAAEYAAAGDIAALKIWDDVIEWLRSFDAAPGASPDQLN